MTKLVSAVGRCPRNPVLSVVVPCHKVAEKQRFLASCLNCLAQQTLHGIQVIIVDDASGDGSLRVITELMHALDQSGCYMELLSLEQHSGVSVARNEGIRRSRSPFIGFLDYDDLWAAEFARKAIDFLSTRPDVEVVLGGTILYRQYGAKAKACRIPIPEDINSISYGQFCGWHLLNNFPVGMGSAVICRGSLFARKPQLLMDHFLSKLSAEDVCFGFKLLSMRVRPYYLRQPLVVARGVTGAPSRSKNAHFSANQKIIQDYIWKVASCDVFEIVRKEAPEYLLAVERKVSYLNDVFLLQRMCGDLKYRSALSICGMRPRLWKAWLHCWLGTRKNNAVRKAMQYRTWLKLKNNPRDLREAAAVISECEGEV